MNISELFILLIIFIEILEHNKIPEGFTEVVTLETRFDAPETCSLRIPQKYCNNVDNEGMIRFIENILVEMNTIVTNYKENTKRCLLSNIFMVTDEAYAVIIIENQYERWDDMRRIKKIRVDTSKSDEKGAEIQDHVRR